jgi:hypothetical protein
MHSLRQINVLFKDLRAKREDAIANLMDSDNLSRVEAAMRIDFESPLTTNGDQLRMIGVNPNTAPLDEIIRGLALWGVYLVRTNCLTDDELRARLFLVLTDPISMIPPNSDMSEFVDFDRDLNLPEVVDRDRFLPRPKKPKVSA